MERSGMAAMPYRLKHSPASSSRGGPLRPPMATCGSRMPLARGRFGDPATGQFVNCPRIHVTRRTAPSESVGPWHGRILEGRIRIRPNPTWGRTGCMRHVGGEARRFILPACPRRGPRVFEHMEGVGSCGRCVGGRAQIERTVSSRMTADVSISRLAMTNCW